MRVNDTNHRAGMDLSSPTGLPHDVTIIPQTQTTARLLSGQLCVCVSHSPLNAAKECEPWQMLRN